MANKFYMMIGLPGSGKSTYIKNMFENEGTDFHKWAILSSDGYIEMRAQELGKTYDEVWASERKNAVKNLKVSLKNALRLGCHIVWDQTNLTAAIRRNRLAKIPASYTKIGCVFTSSKTTREERLDARVGKTIPENVLQNMIKQYEHPTIDEGFDYIYYIHS